MKQFKVGRLVAFRQGSISHYDQDSSFGYRNMRNMSMSSQWAMMQQHQAMIQQAMQQQMMALNPLQFQVINAMTNLKHIYLS